MSKIRDIEIFTAYQANKMFFEDNTGSVFYGVVGLSDYIFWGWLIADHDLAIEVSYLHEYCVDENIPYIDGWIDGFIHDNRGTL